ncbi:MAG: ATP-binding protein [Acidimicrobiales bacterium]
MVHNLPVSLNSFVGRARERSQVSELLRCSRLVTLAGVPGVGKTRLALEVASELVDRHHDGAWLVELASITNPDLAPHAVAAALGIDERRGAALTDGIVDELADRRLLLVLDNCEHLLSGTTRLAGTLLRSCPGLTILATSREPLGIDGELVWRVQPLEVPMSGEPFLRYGLDYSAVRLFVERAANRRPGFRLTTEDSPAVIEICNRLDGIPLAIELAAARTDVLSPDEILQHLDHPLRLLDTRNRSEPSVHKTLKATLDWSFLRLLPAEATLIGRLSVFAGSWKLEAAEAVCSGGKIPTEAVLGLVDALVRKSLVTADFGGLETRYRLLGIIRAHAGRWLDDPAERTRVSDAHCRWYLSQAETADQGHGEVLGRLDPERDNLGAAFEWALAQANPDSALQLSSSLVSFWEARGELEKGRSWLTRALAVRAVGSPRLRARALWGAGLLASLAGDDATAVPLAEQSLALAREQEDLCIARRRLSR